MNPDDDTFDVQENFFVEFPTGAAGLSTLGHVQAGDRVRLQVSLTNSGSVQAVFDWVLSAPGAPIAFSPGQGQGSVVLAPGETAGFTQVGLQAPPAPGTSFGVKLDVTSSGMPVASASTTVQVL